MTTPFHHRSPQSWPLAISPDLRLAVRAPNLPAWKKCLGWGVLMACTLPAVAGTVSVDGADLSVADVGMPTQFSADVVQHAPIATVAQAVSLPDDNLMPANQSIPVAPKNDAPLRVIPAREVSPYTWVVGLSVSNGPVFSGSDRRGNSIRPVLGLKYGRYTLSSGGGGSLLDFDFDAADSGLSARLFEWDNFRLSATLRLDRGRKGENDEVLQGLPDVRTTLRGRIAGVYDFSRWTSVKVALNQDLLGKGGGGVLSTTFRYEYQVTPETELQFAAGFNMANSTHMRSYYGVPASAAGITTNLPQFDPRGGIQSTAFGVELKTAIADYWVLSGGISFSQLRGDARRSPLAVKPNNYSVYIGLAYRH